MQQIETGMENDGGTRAEVFATEQEAVSTLLDRIDFESEGYSKEQLMRWYFFPDEHTLTVEATGNESAQLGYDL